LKINNNLLYSYLMINLKFFLSLLFKKKFTVPSYYLDSSYNLVSLVYWDYLFMILRALLVISKSLLNGEIF